MDDNYHITDEGMDLSLPDIINYFWRLKWWILLTLVVAIVGAYGYLKTQTRYYERTSWIKLNKNENSVNSQFSTLFGVDLSGNKALDDEVFILQSPSLMQKVVENLGLNRRYYHFTNPFVSQYDFLTFKQTEYYGNCPFRISLTPDPLYPESMQPNDVRLEFVHNGDSTYSVQHLTVNGVPRKLTQTRLPYDRPILLNGLCLSLSLDYGDEMADGDRYVATWTEPFTAARGFLKGLSVAIQGAKANRTDIVLMTYRDSSPDRASDILDMLAVVANQEARKYETFSSQEALNFISARLDEIADQLNIAEEGYKDYQASRAIVNSDAQTQLTLESDSQYKDQLTEILLQLEVLRMVYDFMNETPDGVYRLIPSYIVVADAGLNTMITQYNDKVVARDRMVFNSSEKNPKVLSINTELSASKRGIELSLENLIKVYSLRQRDLEKVLEKNRGQISDIPEQQMQLQHLSRKVEVIEPLYRMLQERREEIQIAMYAAEDTFRIVEPAFGNNIPVSPNRKSIYLLAFVFGLGFSPGLWMVRAFLRGKVETKADVEKATDVPVLGLLPRARQKKYPIIAQRGADQLTEAFRILRSNVQSLPGAKVFQVTSSVLGEGKSFVASNLALSLAYIGKKVLLIGMDLRKPVVQRIFKCCTDTDKTLVSYLSGRHDEIGEIIVHSPQADNLHLLFSGVIPADPTALLAGERAEALIAKLKAHYDYIFIDSTPYFPVTDASIINKYVDATLLIIRCDYTTLKLLKEVDAAVKRRINPIRSPYLVINDFNAKAPKYRYSYGDGYGYESITSYGYTYGKFGYGKKNNARP